MHKVILALVVLFCAVKASEQCYAHASYQIIPTCKATCQTPKEKCQKRPGCYCDEGYIFDEILKECVTSCQDRLIEGPRGSRGQATINVKIQSSLLSTILKIITFPFRFVIRVIWAIVTLKVNLLEAVIKLVLNILKGIWKIIGGIVKNILKFFIGLNLIKLGILVGIIRLITGIIKGILNLIIDLVVYKLTLVKTIIGYIFKLIGAIVSAIIKLYIAILRIVATILDFLIKLFHVKFFVRLFGIDKLVGLLERLAVWKANRIGAFLADVFVRHSSFFGPLFWKLSALTDWVIRGGFLVTSSIKP